MNQPKSLITNYLRALSGRPKTPELVGEYVADQHLAKHIAEVEAAFPSYEIEAHDLVAENDSTGLACYSNTKSELMDTLLSARRI